MMTGACSSTWMTDTSTLINAAADYIEQHGWTRGSYERHGRVCMLGALCYVDLDNNGVYPAEKIIERVILARGFTTDPDKRVITNWNDEQKDRRVVIRVLREAAALAASE